MSEESISQWAVVELFGHKTIAGQITKETNLFPLLRIDVPATSDHPAYTVEYGAAAIYGITYVSEAVARATAESLSVKPINVYSPDLVTREQFDKAIDEYKATITRLRALPEGNRASDDDETDDYDDDDGKERLQIPF